MAPEVYDVDALIESIVDGIVAKAGDGWLIMGGKVRRVENADRFGWSAWEITATELPGDQASWCRHGTDEEDE